jgi:energy-coupling factor transporter ATP-binding protein EcfA2
MITRLEATRYRCFERLAIDLSEFQIIVGANGAGKTTLLDIPVLLGELLIAENISNVFLVKSADKPARTSSFRQLIFAQQGNDFSFAVEARLPSEICQQLVDSKCTDSWRGEGVQPSQEKLKNTPDLWPTHIRYELRLALINERELGIKDENLFVFSKSDAKGLDTDTLQDDGDDATYWHRILERKSDGLSHFYPELKESRGQEADMTSFRLKPGLLAMSAVVYQADYYPAANWLYELLTEQTVFLNPDWSKLRAASPPGQEKTIIPSALNLPWLALDLKKQGLPTHASATEKAAYRNPDYADWVAHVKTALPQVEDIEVREREDDHHAYFELSYRGGFIVPSSGLSDGTLRILTLTLLPYLSKQPSILVTEEPENGLHPYAIETVLQSLSSMYDSQVWVSSHSPIVLASCQLNQLLCARQTPSGGVELVTGNEHPRLKDWHGGIDLGSLFAAGILG